MRGRPITLQQAREMALRVAEEAERRLHDERQREAREVEALMSWEEWDSVVHEPAVSVPVRMVATRSEYLPLDWDF